MIKDELHEQGYEINVNISIGTSYASVIEAMASGQVHVGFLTAQQYAFVTTEYPGKVDVLLTSVRNAYEVQIGTDQKEIKDHAQIIAKANTTGYRGETTDALKVSSYYAMLLVRKDDYAGYQTNGIAHLAGKTVGTQSKTSGSGYVYPSFLLHENNLKFVDGNPNASAGEVKAHVIAGHQNSVLALLNNDVDAVFTFFDARNHATAFKPWETSTGKNVFEETKVVALTTPIYNDTISTISSLSPGLRAAIAEAFIRTIAKPDGYDALQIYNHAGYSLAYDKDYDGERALYRFLNP